MGDAPNVDETPPETGEVAESPKPGTAPATTEPTIDSTTNAESTAVAGEQMPTSYASGQPTNHGTALLVSTSNPVSTDSTRAPTWVDRRVHGVLRMCFLSYSSEEVRDRRQHDEIALPMVVNTSSKVLDASLDAAWKMSERDAARQNTIDEKVKWLFALVVVVATFTAGMVTLNSSPLVVVSGVAALVLLCLSRLVLRP